MSSTLNATTLTVSTENSSSTPGTISYFNDFYHKNSSGSMQRIPVIYKGATEPSASLGQDGDVYFMYSSQSGRRLPAGTVTWFAGPPANIPPYTLICNGTLLSRTGTYADLYNAIGLSHAPTYSSSSSYEVGDYVLYNNAFYVCNTAIGTGGESWNSSHWTSNTTQFPLPDMFTAEDGTATGLFIRATDGSSLGAVGTKQIDAIRNIIGSITNGLYYYGGSNTMRAADGAFVKTTSSVNTTDATGNMTNTGVNKVLPKATLNVNSNGSDTNPAYGHANGDDIHPTNMSLLPLIYY